MPLVTDAHFFMCDVLLSQEAAYLQQQNADLLRQCEAWQAERTALQLRLDNLRCREGLQHSRVFRLLQAGGGDAPPKMGFPFGAQDFGLGECWSMPRAHQRV